MKHNNLRYSETYLYKLRKVTTRLDRAFDSVLKRHAGISLSQFTLLLSVGELQPTDQRSLTRFLGYTPGAVSRQIKAAQKSQWLTVSANPHDSRGQVVQLTARGRSQIHAGLNVLENHAFQVFKHSNHSLDLMGHIEELLWRAKEVIDQQNK